MLPIGDKELISYKLIFSLVLSGLIVFALFCISGCSSSENSSKESILPSETTHEKTKAAHDIIMQLGMALDQYRLDTGAYPSSQEGLNALITNPGHEKWDGPYLKKNVPLDPWGKPYIYRFPGTHGEYDLYSFGRDAKPGGKGEDKDVTSWE